ncbi:hypothetical protein JMJ55_25120 [Belnapia sp. T6]|uniref:Lipoprotein n=1 Tax=Belnapia mucosa TaxID=2804532 RepID=A0ABS1VAD4_9PROT|nr:hypothetical protein [Belnapia mucosa]MBL6458625.1 hypothetical protein [Belnapia mucosa]
MRRVLLPLALALLLGGCNLAADVAGAFAGGGAALASGNPAVGFGIGIGVRAATSAGIRWVVRSRHTAEQDEIAAVIGSLAPGESRAWEIRHSIPIGNERGEVRLVRILDNALAPCREALFSVEEGDKPDSTRQWFLTTACWQESRWKWAAAEPATARWGSLQ